MKIKLLLTTFVSSFIIHTSAFAQGALTPPAGAPAPGMKSLDQIEPRIAVNTLAGTSNGMHAINLPGNYYLTANVVGTASKHGILINAHDVTIDLNGFTILGTGTGDFHGITLLNDDGGDGARLTVRNGIIRNWGGGGIEFLSYPATLLEHLSILGCKRGINLYGADVIRHCNISGAYTATIGIRANGPYTRVEDCTIKNIYTVSGSGSGIFVYHGLVEDCVVRSVAGNPSVGIQVELAGGVVSRCKVDSISSSSGNAVGIKATTVRDSSVTDGTAVSGSGKATGIAGQHLERCTVKNISGSAASGSGIGLQGDAAGGLIEQCLADTISGAAAFGIQVSGNNFSVLNTKVHNVVGTGLATFGISSESSSLTAAGCDVSSITNSTGSAWGIFAQGGLIERSNVSRTRNDGIYAYSRCTVLNCRVDEAGYGGTGAGILGASNSNQIEGNHISNCDVGIQGPGTFLRNVCYSNTTNYSVAGALVAPIVTAGGAAAATNPLANLSL